MKRRKWLLSLTLAACAQAGVCQAQTAPPMQREPDEVLPPLPAPTEQHLQRGRELLEKIAHVIADVPLTDAEAVLKLFGFTDLYTWTHPTYVRKGPKAKDGAWARPEELVGTGFLVISVDPWINDPRDDTVGAFHARFNTQEACIPIDDVRRRFSAQAQARMTTSRITDIHPVARPPRLHKVGYMSFRPLQTPLGLNGSATFSFDYQVCATDFGFAYRNSLGETNK